MHAFQADKVLAIFLDIIRTAEPGYSSATFGHYSAGLVAFFTNILLLTPKKPSSYKPSPWE